MHGYCILQKAVILMWWLALLVFLILAFFNHPSLDDYIYTVIFKEQGLFESQKFWWNEWSGRYFSNLVISLNPLSFQSVLTYKILTFLLIAVFFGSLYYCLIKAFTALQSKTERHFAAATASLLFVLMLPCFSEGFYWMASAITYQIAGIMSMLLLIAASRLAKPGISKVSAFLLFTASIVLCIAIVGSNEISMLSLLFVLFAFCVYRIWKDRRFPLRLFVVLIITAVCSVMVILSPGNAARSTHFIHSGGPGALLAHSAVSTIHFLWRNLIPFFFAGVLLSMLLIRQRGTDEAEDPKPALYLHPLLSLAILLLLIFLLFLSGWYSTNAHLVARSENVVFFWTFAGFIWIIRNTAFFLTHTLNKRPGLKTGKALIVASLLLFLACFVRENNLRSGIGDLVLGRALSYERQMEERYRIYSDTALKDCTVQAINPRPVLLFIGEADTIVFPAQNDALRKYYHKRSITIKPND